MKKLIGFLSMLVLVIAIALPSLVLAIGPDTATVDASVPTSFSGMTLQEIYGYQGAEGSTWHEEEFFEIGSQRFYEMIEAGELEMLSPGVYLDNTGVLHIDVAVGNEYTGMTLEEVYGFQISSRSTSMPTRTWNWGVFAGLKCPETAE